MRSAALGFVIATFGLVPGSAPLAAQSADTLVVEVRVEGAGATLTLAAGGPDSTTVLFSTREIFEYVELAAPARTFMDLVELRQALGVEVLWIPARLLLIVRDPTRSLPITRRQLDSARARSQARAAIPIEHRVVGPFLAMTVDEESERLVEAGYSLGRVVGHWSNSTLTGNTWSVNANPVSRLWLSYRDSDRTDPQMGARLALGRTWVAADYDGRDLEAMGAAVVGPVVLFATTQDRAVVTWRGPIQVQVGYADERGILRVAYGRVPLSPFSVPWVR